MLDLHVANTVQFMDLEHATVWHCGQDEPHSN